MLEMTLNELIVAQKKAFTELIKKAGTVSHLAKMIDVPVSTAQGWAHRGRISKEGARKVEQHSLLKDEFKAVDLRPELQQ